MKISGSMRVSVSVFCLLLWGCSDEARRIEAEDNMDHAGLATYTKYCASCHNAGVADAPKLGDAKAWGYRLKKSNEQLLQSTIVGIPPGMPKRGLCMSCSDEQLADAVDYMLDQVRS